MPPAFSAPPPRPGLALLLGGLAATAATAQPAAEYQTWNAVMATAHLGQQTPSLAFWADLHVRRTAAGVQAIARPGVGVQLTPGVSLWGGYAWTPTFSDGDPAPVHEHRAWEQVLLQHETSFRLNLQSRTRLEQRFHQSGGEVGLRLRQFLRVSWRPSAEVPVGLLASDELFIGLNATSWGQPAGVDQNRLFVGPFFQLAPWARLEAGYLFVYLDRAADRFLHTFSVLAVLTPKF